MEKPTSKYYAALTGDIVRSSRMTPEQFQSVKETLKKAVAQLDWVKTQSGQPAVTGTIDFYRGDGWQLLLNDPRTALRVCLYLCARLKADCTAQTRIAVGIGTVSKIEPNAISTSTGQAFELSGSALDDLKPLKRMTLAFPYYTENKYDSLISVFELCDAICQKWTPKQSEAVSWALQGFNQSEIAEKVNPPVKPQSVGQQLKSACWHAIEPALKRAENMEFNFLE